MNEIEITNLLFLAHEAYRKNEDEKAKKYYSQVLEKDNNNLIALIYRGNSNRMLEKYDEAFDDFTRVEELLGNAIAKDIREFISWRFEEVKSAKFRIENYLNNLKEANIAYENKEYLKASTYYLNMPSYPSTFNNSLGEFVVAGNEDFKRLSYAAQLQICVRLVVCKLHNETIDKAMLHELKKLIDAIDDDLIGSFAGKYAEARIKREGYDFFKVDSEVEIDKWNDRSEVLFREYIKSEPTASALKILEECKSEIKLRLEGNNASAQQFFKTIEQITKKRKLDIPEEELANNLEQMIKKLSM